MRQLELFQHSNITGISCETPVVGQVRPLTDGRKAQLTKLAHRAIRNSGGEALPDMLGQPPAVNTQTSVDAADAIKPCADTLRRLVLRYIGSQGKTGATDEECQLALNMGGSTQRPRRVELFQSGKICMAPMMRKTRAGRMANVWRTPS